jgi:hypothetical protein
MRSLVRLTVFLRNVFEKRRVETEEVRSYRALLTEEDIIEGIRSEETRREALGEKDGAGQ